MTDDISKVDAVPCSTLHQCSTPALCASVGTCKGRHVLPAKMRAAFDRLESATTPAEVGERHVRHEGGGVIALYEGDTRIRDVGVTPGWDFRDRDEFIVRYNEHATLARQLAEAREVHEAFAGDAARRLNEMESSLAAATRRVAEVEGLVRRYRDEVPLGHQPHMIAHLVDDLLTKEPTK